MDNRTILAANKATFKARDAYQKSVISGKADSEHWHHLKHKNQYFGFIECDMGGGPFIMFSANDDQVVWEYFWTGKYEEPIVKEWARMVKSADIILDVGAYTGFMALMPCTLNPKCKVHCFEPMLRTVERLKINIKVNRFDQRIHINPLAASDKGKAVKINMPRPPDFLGSGNSIKQKTGIKTVATTIISTVRIDDYIDLQHGEKISRIKLDVEGHEMEALSGMAKIITNHRPEMIVEVWPDEKAEVFEFFDKLGYMRKQLRGLNWLFWPAEK